MRLHKLSRTPPNRRKRTQITQRNFNILVTRRRHQLLTRLLTTRTITRRQHQRKPKTSQLMGRHLPNPRRPTRQQHHLPTHTTLPTIPPRTKPPFKNIPTTTPSSANCLTHRTHKTLHIHSRRLKRTHQPHLRTTLIKTMKKKLLQQHRNRPLRQQHKHHIRLHLLRHPNPRNLPQTLRQQPRHRIRMTRIPQPHITFKHPHKLRRNIPHLRRQLHPLLTEKRKTPCILRIKKHHRLTTHHPILRPTKRQHIHTHPPRKLIQPHIKKRRRITQPRPIHLHQQTMLMRKTRQPPKLPRTIHRPPLRRLRHRHHARLRHMHITHTHKTRVHQIHRQLPIWRRHRHQLTTDKRLRTTTLMNRQMRDIRTNHRLVRLHDTTQTKDVRPRPIIQKKDLRFTTKHLLKQGSCLSRDLVIPVRHRIPAINLRQGLQDRGVNASMIIAAKTSED